MAEVEELRVQPQDILAEQSVLGLSLLTRVSLFLCENTLSLETFLVCPSFDFPSHGDLSDRGDAIDATTVRTILG